MSVAIIKDGREMNEVNEQDGLILSDAQHTHKYRQAHMRRWRDRKKGGGGWRDRKKGQVDGEIKRETKNI